MPHFDAIFALRLCAYVNQSSTLSHRSRPSNPVHPSSRLLHPQRSRGGDAPVLEVVVLVSVCQFRDLVLPRPASLLEPRRLALLLGVLLFRFQILEGCLVPVHQRPNALEQKGLTSGNKQRPMPREIRAFGVPVETRSRAPITQEFGRTTDSPGTAESDDVGRLGSTESSTNNLTSSREGSSHHHVV